MERYWDHTDRKHWEVRLGRITLARYCKGAPCSHLNWPAGQPHPVTLTIVRRGQ